jgi:hypothetical protein
MGCLVGLSPNMTKATGSEPTLITYDSPNNVTHISPRDLSFTPKNADDRGVIAFEANITEATIDGRFELPPRQLFYRF